jgi:DNA-binding SARP family transcriptional activator/Tfp pilus assembly protein PilF
VSVVSESLARGDALLRAGKLDAALAAYGTADGRCPQVGVAWRTGRAHQLRGDVEVALASYDLDATDFEDQSDVVCLLAWRSTAYFLHGDHDRCRRDARDAWARSAGLANDSALATVHTALALLAALDGDRNANEQHYDAALQHALLAGDELQELRIRANRGSRLVEEGSFEQAVEELERGLQVRSAQAFPTLLGLALTNRAEAFLGLGRLEESTADLIQAQALFRSVGSRMVAHALSISGEVHRARGETALARLAYEEALRATATSGDVQSSVRALTGLALLLATEETEQAVEHLRVAREQGETLHSVRVELASAVVARARGDETGALTLARAGAAAARGQRDRSGLAEALEVEASLDVVRARALLEQALTVWNIVGNPIGAARARLRLASVTDRDEAVGLATEAEVTLRRVGARELAARASSFLDELERGPGGTSVRCLGAFRVLHDGVPVQTSAWGSKKPRDLLKLLLAQRGRPLTREQIMDVLWPDQAPETCAGRLSVALSALRKVLSPPGRSAGVDSLVLTRNAVFVDVDLLEVDVERFLRLADQGQRELSRGQPGAWATLERAEVLYRGDFLAEDRYEDWAEPLRNQARESYGAVLRTLARRAVDDSPDEAMRRFLRLLEFDEYDEEAHLGLVRTLVAVRRHGEARRRYDRYVTSMRDLGLRAAPMSAATG